MPISYKILFDRDEQGEIKINRSGDYRFALELLDTDAKTSLMVVKGFRVGKSLTRLQMPSTSYHDRIFAIVDLGREFEERILTYLREKLSGAA